MNEFQLKYGTNPNQKPARIFMADGSDLPVTILNGKPGYINFLDAFNSYQLVRDLKKALGQPAAASFKHVSPAGAAIGLPLDETLRKMYHISAEAELSPLACAYARARRSGVTAIVQPGGSIRDDQVIATCNKYGIAMAFCGIRLFHH